MENEINLRPPYVVEYNKLCAFFDGDPTIEIGKLDDKTKSCTIKVSDKKKAQILGDTLTLYHLNFKIVCNDKTRTFNGEEDMAYLLADTPLFSRYMVTKGYPHYQAVMLTPDCVPVDTDNAFSPSGCDAYTPVQLARQLFYGNHINFQTDFE